MHYILHTYHFHDITCFFSSAQYTLFSDVLVVFGNEHEMSGTGEDCIHAKISYRNITHSRDTVLVLMDATKDRVIHGITAVNVAQSVEQLVSLQVHSLRGFSSNRADVCSDSFIMNEKLYFSCPWKK